MKKTVRWNGLIATVAVLAMSALLFSCTDTTTTSSDGGSGGALALKGTIKGQVVDINNNPVEGATVILLNKRRSTNEAGEYVFTNIPVTGQLGCEYECDEYPYLITVLSPTVRVEDVEVPLYANAYTAAFLSFTSLQANVPYDMDSTSGDWQAVANMGVQAIPAIMRRMNANVNGFVIDHTGVPVSGALVTLELSSYDSPPNAIDIWDDGDGSSSWAIADTTTTTTADGLFIFTGVPEGSNSSPVAYNITITAPGFVMCDDPAWVWVGMGGHTYWVDGEAPYGDGNGWLNQSDPIALCPGFPPSDPFPPYVTACNLPPSVITVAQLSGPFTWIFSEPVNTDLGRAIIRVGPGAPLDVTQSWDTTTDPAHPVLTVTPDNPLPEGLTITFELRDIRDVAGNAYFGRLIDGTPDAFTSLGNYVSDVARSLRTSGDPDLMVASNLAQDPALANPLQPIGGKSGNVPQANNLNLLDWDDTIGLNVIGDVNNEANWISISWTEAEPVEEGADGKASYYRVYAEKATGGFAAGVPVFVAQTAFSWETPVTNWTGTLQQVNNAIINWNNNNGSDPDVPTIPALNGTTNYFDDGFFINMAVTTVNNDEREGPYSNVAQVMDVVPPTVADQGEGFDTTVPTNWAVKTLTVDLDALDLIGGDPGDDQYSGADFQAFVDSPSDVDVLMSEDLAPPLNAQNVTFGGGGQLLNSFSISQAEGGIGGLPQVTLVFTGLVLAQQNDHVLITVNDEAGNTSEPGTAGTLPPDGDSVIHFYDGIPALIATGVAAFNPEAVDEESMTLTFDEPVDPTQAVDLANYTLNGGAFPLDATAVLDETGTIVTITAPTGLGVVTGEYVVVANVQDLILNPVSGLGFQAENQVAVANDGVIKPPEVCDPTDLVGEDCLTQGFDEGTLACSADNLSFDTTGCITWACGNDIWEGAEVCDGTDLAGEDCVTLGCTGGTLACAVDCSAFDLTGCTGCPECGNNVIEGTEVCDGTDLAGETCETQLGAGYTGDLGCAVDCSAFDTGACVAP